MSPLDPTGSMPDPPVAARETRRARARARRAATRRRVCSALVLAFSLLLLAGGGLAYHDHAQRRPLELPMLPDSGAITSASVDSSRSR